MRLEPPSDAIRFFVPATPGEGRDAGEPVPAGSKDPFVFTRRDGSPVRRAGGSIACGVRDSSGDRLDRWKAKVAGYARQAYTGRVIEGPVACMMLFVLERPKTDWGTGRNAGRLKPRAPAWPLKRPDSTKLVRAVEDALTGILWSDDSVIVLGPIAAKRYRMAFEPTPGVHVHAWDVLDYPQPMLTAWEVGR